MPEVCPLEACRTEILFLSPLFSPLCIPLSAARTKVVLSRRYFPILVSVTKRRTRLLTVRLTDSEYDSLSRVCDQESVRSMSDFARQAILDHLRFGGFEKTSLGGNLDTLGHQLLQVDEAIKSLSTRIEHVLGKQSV